MKKMYGIILLFTTLVAFKPVLQAQTPCAGISTQVVPVDPQTGQVNHFYVKVTLDQTYDRDITVYGWITLDQQGNENAFSVTIHTGDLTAESSNTYYEASPGNEVPSIRIISITPPTVTKNGITFSTRCSGVNITLNNLNAVGQMHNDYQEYILAYITGQNLALSDTNNLKQIIVTKTEEFFQNKGIILSQSILINFGNTVGINSLQYNAGNYSTSGANILNSLNTLLSSYDESNDAAFFSSLNALQQQALGLPDQNEVYTVGIPVTIAIYSMNYWKNNADNWSDILTTQDSLRNVHPLAFVENRSEQRNGLLAIKKLSGPNTSDNFNFEQKSKKYTFKKTCKIGYGQLGFADVSGGIGGAYGGVALGPGGALAGAILGSSASSLGNLSGQVMGCLFDWW